jgi:hypothetical protein
MAGAGLRLAPFVAAIPARRPRSHPGQHGVPGDLRKERRGRLRVAGLPRLLLRRRIRRDDDAGRDDLALRRRARLPDAGTGRQRRRRRRAGCLLRPVPGCHRLCRSAGDVEFAVHADDPPITVRGGSWGRRRFQVVRPIQGASAAGGTGSWPAARARLLQLWGSCPARK